MPPLYPHSHNDRGYAAGPAKPRHTRHPADLMTEPITLAPPSTPGERQRPQRRLSPRALDGAILVGLALISYVPMFLTQPGKVAADTKQYLYLDPGRLIQSAISMWDPDVGAGTVTHQNIGFLFPMGPYYWLVAELHIPVWVGQRFWMGSLFFAAGTGVWYLGRVMGLSRSGRLAAALAYMLTPFVIDYIARISAIVMPWAALGWMLAFTILAVRRGGWRYPALFAVVIALVGGVNATSILLVGLAPLLWLIYAVWGTREVPFRAAGPLHSASACSPSGSRSGGSPGSGPKAPTASTSSSTPRRSPPSRRPRSRPRPCADSATGTSTGRTSWAHGPRRRSATSSGPG